MEGGRAASRLLPSLYRAYLSYHFGLCTAAFNMRVRAGTVPSSGRALRESGVRAPPLVEVTFPLVFLMRLPPYHLRLDKLWLEVS